MSRWARLFHASAEPDHSLYRILRVSVQTKILAGPCGVGWQELAGGGVEFLSERLQRWGNAGDAVCLEHFAAPGEDLR